ncbi:MAG: hypothetical protein KBG39_06165 [Opitutaceae bacterium]|nr:hypothetical protein [Opitutaceae bacterium]
MSASTILSFAALIVSGLGCLVCAGWMLTMIRLGRDLDRESEHGFRLPESKGEREQLHAARSLKL